MQGVSLLFAGLAASLAFITYCQIRQDNLLGAFHWLTRARYPRGFPVIVGFELFVSLCLTLLAILLALAGNR